MNPLQFRKAQLADKEAVIALSAQIWEGNDYVSDLFDQWLNDERGRFSVVYDGETLVAFGKVSEHSSGEWWLEGLRVDPRHRGKGVARQLHQYGVDQADKIGWGMLRCTTASETKPVHRLLAQTGFRHTGKHGLMRLDDVAGAERGDIGTWTAVSPQALPTLQQQLQGELYYEGWKLYLISPQLETLCQNNQLYWWRGQQGFVILKEDKLCYTRVPLPDLPSLLVDLHALVTHDRLYCNPPLTHLSAFTQVGWQERPDKLQMWAYERPLAKGEPNHE